MANERLLIIEFIDYRKRHFFRKYMHIINGIAKRNRQVDPFGLLDDNSISSANNSTC